jgi:AcrR family transcriptional regulator
MNASAEIAPKGKRAATRARICDAAAALFFERGFAVVTMEQIAAAADIQRSTLYLHFREKDEILAAIAEDYTAKLRPVIARLSGPVPTREELGQWVDEFATFVSDERAATELLVSLSDDGRTTGRDPRSIGAGKRHETGLDDCGDGHTGLGAVQPCPQRRERHVKGAARRCGRGPAPLCSRGILI